MGNGTGALFCALESFRNKPELKNNCLEIMKLLLNRKDLDINAKYQEEHGGFSTFFIEICFYEIEELIKIVINLKSLDINGVENTAWTHLFNHGNEKMLKLLVKRKDFEVNTQFSEDGETILIACWKNNYLDVVKSLLKRQDL